MVIKNHIKYLFLLVLIVFVFNKFLLRPWVVAHAVSAWMVILVYSVPNFVEAVMGTFILAGFARHLKHRFHERLGGARNVVMYLIATGLAGCYVITQELRIHNIGGNNVYDPYDVLASVIGLLFAFSILTAFGMVEEKVDRGVLGRG